MCVYTYTRIKTDIYIHTHVQLYRKGQSFFCLRPIMIIATSSLFAMENILYSLFSCLDLITNSRTKNYSSHVVPVYYLSYLSNESKSALISEGAKFFVFINLAIVKAQSRPLSFDLQRIQNF